MESNYQVETQMRNKFALHMFHVKLPMDFTNKINSYIDNSLIPLDDNYGKVKGNAELENSYSKGLVGQIRQNERSAQLDCKVLEDTEDAKLLKSTLDATSQEYLRQIGHGDSVPDVFEAWQFIVLLVTIIHYMTMMFPMTRNAWHSQLYFIVWCLHRLQSWARILTCTQMGVQLMVAHISLGVQTLVQII